MDAEATEKGMAIVEEVLRAFAKKRKEGDQVSEEEEMASLKEVVSEYKDRALSDPWVQRALECL